LAELGIRLRNPDRVGEHRVPCPWCDKGPRDDALAVRVEPDGGATWTCHRCGERGGIGGKPSGRPHRAAPRPQERQPEPERHDTLAPWGRARWASCETITHGTPAAAYLERRSCELPPAEGDLRWHPAIKHHRSGHVGPALVGLVTDALTGEPISLHRTWIQPDGSGKAAIEKPRLLLARHRSHGVIRLWPDDEVTRGLTIGEGIETCLAANWAWGLTPCWAAISAGNFASFPVLPGIERLTLLVDHDFPNPKTGKRTGQEAARALIERYVAAGLDPERDIQVRMSPTEGEDIADWIAAWRGAA
jgi:hypothetical protein